MKHTNYIILRSFYTAITNKNEQFINEGVNISTRFVTKAGERLQEDEHILVDDTSGYATLLMVRMERSDNVDKVDNSLALFSSSHAFVCEKNVPTTEHNVKVKVKGKGYVLTTSRVIGHQMEGVGLFLFSRVRILFSPSSGM